MKLDPRIIEGKKPLTCFDTEEAKKFIGKECYFSNCKSHYKNLSAFEKFVSLTDYCIGELTAIMDLGDRVFDVDQQCKEFRYCLPCEWVKEKEPKKKYRLFTHKEFTDTFNIGEPIIFRRKQSKHLYEYHVLFIGCCFLDNDVDVVLGNDRFSLKTLFNNYEWRQHDSYKWQPFGVPEE